MIFEHTFHMIAVPSEHTGVVKTETRRPVKRGDKPVFDTIGNMIAINNKFGNSRYSLMQIRSVQPNYGCKGIWYKTVNGVTLYSHLHLSNPNMTEQEYLQLGWLPLRIQIIGFYPAEPAGLISDESLKAEGYRSLAEFLSITGKKEVWGIKFRQVLPQIRK